MPQQASTPPQPARPDGAPEPSTSTPPPTAPTPTPTPVVAPHPRRTQQQHYHADPQPHRVVAAPTPGYRNNNNGGDGSVPRDGVVAASAMPDLLSKNKQGRANVTTKTTALTTSTAPGQAAGATPQKPTAPPPVAAAHAANKPVKYTGPKQLQPWMQASPPERRGRSPLVAGSLAETNAPGGVATALQSAANKGPVRHRQERTTTTTQADSGTATQSAPELEQTTSLGLTSRAGLQPQRPVASSTTAKPKTAKNVASRRPSTSTARRSSHSSLPKDGTRATPPVERLDRKPSEKKRPAAAVGSGGKLTRLSGGSGTGAKENETAAPAVKTKNPPPQGTH